MRLPDYYETDVLAFFAGKPWALPLYEAVFAQMDRLFPDAAVKVQKSQISFYGRHLFAAVSLPLRRKRPGQKSVLSLLSDWAPRWRIHGSPWRWSPTPTGGPTMCWCPDRKKWTKSS